MKEKREHPSKYFHVISDTEDWRRITTEGRAEIVVAPGGLFVVQSSDLFSCLSPLYLEDFERVFGKAGLLKAGWGGLSLRWRIPFTTLASAAAFFREAWRRNQQEEILLLFLYYETGRYALVHPQILSAGQGHVECAFPETPLDAVRFGSLHSHGRERAHHSSEDRMDDLGSPGLHVIIGDVQESLPTLRCVCSTGTRCFPVAPWDVFEEPPKEEIPEEWFFRDTALKEEGA